MALPSVAASSSSPLRALFGLREGSVVVLVGLVGKWVGVSMAGAGKWIYRPSISR
ncbi:MAG: hypothetical protein H7836_07545 [Magnetococcus sp. YQC-3]